MTFRVLDDSEWSRLVEDGIEPFATHGLPDIPQRKHWRILIAEEAGRIVGASLLHEAVLNHWWIAPAARRQPTVVQGLWDATKAELDRAGVTLLHATVDDKQIEVQQMVERLGYVEGDGKLYVLYVPNCLLNRTA